MSISTVSPASLLSCQSRGISEGMILSWLRGLSEAERVSIWRKIHEQDFPLGLLSEAEHLCRMAWRQS